jgi:hypothetical protein
VDKYANYVRKCMWQLCGWGRVDISMTFHKRAFDFLRTTALEKLVYILVTMNETSILHLPGGYSRLHTEVASVSFLSTAKIVYQGVAEVK